MKNITKISIALLAFASFAGHGQTKPARKFGKMASPCASTEYEALLQQKEPSRKGTLQFEQWLAPKITSVKRKRLQKDGNDNVEVVTIPVVVHIIHDGDAIGESENIADEQVLSQITVLNQDFRKMEGTPGFNTNPVGADTGIEFCLAKRDPQGFYTSGIKRHKVTNSVLTLTQMEELKTQTQWNPEKYLNIWVVQAIVMDMGGIMGYAQFPTDSGLEGLDDPGNSTAANTDGIVMVYGGFGSSDLYPAGNYFPGADKGQITAHEVGHYFGLRHIWGDMGNCNGTDFCDDTPTASAPNFECPGPEWDSCPDSPGFDMVSNYMDYTNDLCRNVFTLDQKDRMLAVLTNSPRRASLLTSDGCNPGIALANDASFNLLKLNTQCNTSFTPQALLKNNGNNTITSATITYIFDEGQAQLFNWSGNLAAGEQIIVTLPESTSNTGKHLLYANLITVNETTDASPSDNEDTRPFSIAGTYNTQEVVLTIQTDGASDETYWELKDSSNTIIASVFTISFQPPVTTFTVNNGECYTFTIYDHMGNGICCDWGEGFYNLKTSEGVLINEGGAFGNMEETNFTIDTTLGNTTFSNFQNVKLYPNPAKNTLTIDFDDETGISQNFSIYNTLGQLMDSGKITSTVHSLDVTKYANGIYFVKLAKGQSTTTLQFIKQ